jgi:hypothetical protein
MSNFRHRIACDSAMRILIPVSERYIVSPTILLRAHAARYRSLKIYVMKRAYRLLAFGFVGFCGPTFSSSISFSFSDKTTKCNRLL